MSKPPPSAYALEERRQRELLLRDRRVVVLAVAHLIAYVLGWVILMPWVVIAPATYLWTCLMERDTAAAAAFVQQGLGAIPTSMLVSVAAIATLIVLAVHPYRSGLRERLDERIREAMAIRKGRRLS